MTKTLLCLALAMAAPALAQEGKKKDPMVERGRYVVLIGGCNDCHTAGYASSGGKTPEKDWLLGDALGWRGPWGTTYATNLRLSMGALSEDEWVKKAKTLSTRPPMPWFNVQAMTERDQRAVHRYVRSLGPAGKPAPDYLPPHRQPPRPFVEFPG